MNLIINTAKSVNSYIKQKFEAKKEGIFFEQNCKTDEQLKAEDFQHVIDVADEMYTLTAKAYYKERFPQKRDEILNALIDCYLKNKGKPTRAADYIF